MGSTTRFFRTLLSMVAALALVLATVTDAQAARSRTDLEWIAEQVLLDAHNTAREAASLAPMTMYRDVRDVARDWTDHQAARRTLQHNPNYQTQICCATALAENVAFRTVGPKLTDAAVRAAVTEMHKAYMQSSGHRRNILGAYPQVGIGMVLVKAGSQWEVWSTTNFRTPDSNAPGTGIPEARDVEDTCGKAKSPSFSDVPATSVHAANIACIEDAGVTAGKADGSYGPKEFLSRGQIATFLMRTLEAAGAKVPEGAACSEGAHRVGMSAMRAWKIFTTDDCDDSREVTRAEMATWSVRALQTALGKKVPAVDADYFKDDNHMSGNVQGANNAIAAWGVVTGTGNDNFAPESLLRRDQMATFLARLLDAALEPA